MDDTQPKFQKFWGTFCIFGIFGKNNRIFCSMRRATWRSLLIGASKWQKLSIFGFGMEKYAYLPMAKKFGQLLSPQKGQKHSKNDLTTPFWHTGSSVWSTEYWRGKWRSNWKILPALECRQLDRFRKHTWSSFGHREGLQKRVQTSTMHRESGVVHRGKIASLTKFCSVFRPVSPSLTFSLS